MPAPALHPTSDDPSAWIDPAPGASLEFRTTGQGREVALIPFNRIMDERYAIYWKVT